MTGPKTWMIGTPELPPAFWAKVESTPSGCWEWTGSKHSKGYGRIGRSDFAHRLAYAALVGPIPAGMQVDHRCHNRICVYPGHLRAVTPKQNQENRSGVTRKKRSAAGRGVYLDRRDGSWYVQVQSAGRTYNGGRFRDPVAAEKAAVALRNKIFTHNEADRRGVSAP